MPTTINSPVNRRSGDLPLSPGARRGDSVPEQKTAGGVFRSSHGEEGGTTRVTGPSEE
jgi:hypothetical protein